MPAGDVRLRGDEVRLSQVLGNLLGNAIRYTSTRGSIAVGLQRRGSSARIEVRDDGAGIESQDLPFVFDSFWLGDRSAARPHHGLGLGLTIVRQLVEMHGGAVVARSDGPGHGATFEVLLPIVAAPADAVATSRADT